MDFQAQIEAALASMRPSEAEVARHLLRSPGKVATESLREVAAWCGTSDATVLRTCRAAGFDGYQDLKYHVLRELTGGGVPETRRQPAELVAADDVRASLAACQPALADAAARVRRSKRVAIVGSGASGGVGMVLADVLCTLGKPAQTLPDEASVRFALAPRTDFLLLIAISHSGETRLPLYAVREAHVAKVPTIGLTNQPSSELGRSVDLLLPTRVVERPEGSFSITPRICQLAVLERLIERLRVDSHDPAGLKGKPRRFRAAHGAAAVRAASERESQTRRRRR
jgi:DNA-binding MurR/RpiR family transcriptional regulator